jgi:hypothetical protein
MRRPGCLSSPASVCMFGITTFMFVLGLVALVLDSTPGFQQMQLLLDSTSSGIWSSTKTNIIIAVGATITRIMARLLDSTRCPSMLTLTNQYILSDVICAWRAVVLLNKDKRVIANLTLFILGTTVCHVELHHFRLAPIDSSCWQLQPHPIMSLALDPSLTRPT